MVRESKHEFHQDEQSLKHRLAILAAGGSAARRAARSFGGSVATLRLEIARTARAYTRTGERFREAAHRQRLARRATCAR